MHCRPLDDFFIPTYMQINLQNQSTQAASYCQTKATNKMFGQQFLLKENQNILVIIASKKKEI